MVNIVPMAGEGRRFVKAGYVLPKPLIPVSGKPMIVRVIESLPPAKKTIFIVRKEQVDKYKIDELLKINCPGAIVIPVSKTTSGQASTCMLAMPYLEQNEEIFIAACDNSFVYNQNSFENLKNKSTIDSIVWTFTKNKLLTEKPDAWGWVKLADDRLTIEDMSVKIPVSNTPYNDHAAVASFYFKKAEHFKAAYELMVKEDFRISSEFYIDSMPIYYKKLGRRSVIFDVDLYIGWGKPADLYNYEEKEYNYHYGLGKFDEDTRTQDLWKKYFVKLK